MDKKLYPKAPFPLYMAGLSIFLMISILFIHVKWIMIGGLFISFLLSIASLMYGITNLRFIYKNEDIFRGENMSWISICLGAIAFLSMLPFIVTFLMNI
jgi:hypothetical protein